AGALGLPRAYLVERDEDFVTEMQIPVEPAATHLRAAALRRSVGRPGRAGAKRERTRSSRSRRTRARARWRGRGPAKGAPGDDRAAPVATRETGLAPTPGESHNRRGSVGDGGQHFGARESAPTRSKPKFPVGSDSGSWTSAPPPRPGSVTLPTL